MEIVEDFWHLSAVVIFCRVNISVRHSPNNLVHIFLDFLV